MDVSDFGKAMAKMHRTHSWDYLYRQLAEECAELNKACLKLVRATRNETPMMIETAMDNYIEEIADVWLMIAIARTDMTQEEKAMFDKTVSLKYNRMMERLEKRAEMVPLPGTRAIGCGCEDLTKRMEDDLK